MSTAQELDWDAAYRGMPTAKLRARLLAMATETGISVIAVDPAYTSKWGAQHWHKPLAAHHPQTTGHHAASVAIGRRALGHAIRRRVAPPQSHQSDVAGHRTTQAESGVRQRVATRHPRPGPQTRSARPPGAKNAGRHATQHRSGRPPGKTQFRLVFRNGRPGQRYEVLRVGLARGLCGGLESGVGVGGGAQPPSVQQCT